MTQMTLGVSPPSPPPATPPHNSGHLQMTTQTVVTSPTNRTRLDIGVGEQVRLRISGANGTINWTISGSSTLSTTSGSSVILTAHDRQESTTVTATDASCSCQVSTTFNVIEPSAVQMQQAPSTNIWHTHNIPSVGIRTQIFILPDTVSFANIEISEDDCGGIVTGYFVGTPLDGVRHAGHGAGSWVSMLNHVAGKGTEVAGRDTAQSGHCNFGLPYAAGTFDWPIPWLFRVGSGASKNFTTVHQRFNINAGGDMTVAKAGANGAAALTDPSSTY